MNRKLLTIGAVVAMLVVVAAPFAFAQRMHGRGGHGDMAGAMFLGHLQQAKAALGLSDQQVTDIQNIVADLKAQNEQYRQSLQGGLQSVAQILIANPNDLAAAQAQLDKQEQAEHQMKSNALAAASKALNVLTPDQRAKLGTMLQERAQRHMQK